VGLQQFTNNASATIAASISAAATSLAVTAGTGALFPAISGSQFFVATLIKANTPTVYEIVRVTSRTTDTMTIVRAQEGTTALAWNAGDTLALLPTAGAFAGFAQNTDVQAQNGNYAIDIGSANAYAVSLNPPLTAHIIGVPIRVLFQHTNTGASTFNDGAGVAQLLTNNGVTLAAGEAVAGAVGEVVWNGSSFNLTGVQAVGFSQLTGLIAPTQVPASAVTQFAPTLFTSPVFTGNPTAPTPVVGDADASVATTAFVNPGSSLNTNGYRKNPDGSITQWGQIPYSGSGATLTLTFPLPWPGGLFSITFTPQVGGYSPGVQSFNANQLVMSMNNLGGTAQTFYWIAQGH
jgi:hypothetical protein